MKLEHEILLASGQGLLGALLGYLIATLVESAVHQHVSDARPRVVRAWRRYPRLLGLLLRASYSHHTIHHLRTYRADHVTQFRDEEERRALDAELATLGRHGEIISKSNYAVKLHGSGALAFVLPLLPFGPILYVLLGPWALLGAIPTLVTPAILSNWIHPYLHMPHAEALARAPKLLSWLLGTRYMRAVARNHFMHHRHMNCNFNLLLGGDLLRGTHRSPSPSDAAEMRRVGMPLE